ncbi:MAG: rhodanese-like domain-containing protein [Proteobacteria bacterium]|nr:rhodanese-like domain-containing protein [Pseudomonadota bacterium]
MTQKIRKKISALFGGSQLPIINENSLLREIAESYPHLYDFIERKYGIKIGPEEILEPLKTFVSRLGLPPAQIVFMEVQMDSLSKGVKEITAQDTMNLLTATPTLSLLDVRESWELKLGSIPKALPLTATLLDEILQRWDKNNPVILYCHFGIRSLDAASFLADRGFTKVFILKGGIDNWSTEIDPTIPRYDGAYC